MNPSQTAKNPDFKKKALFAFVHYFETELKSLAESAKAAHLAATHEESRAEDRHDTFAIEASYLAVGQAVRVADLEKTLQELKGYLESQRPLESAVGGALVVLETEGKQLCSLIAHHGGGTQVKVDSRTVSLVSPSSPLGEHLTDLTAGDEFSVDSKSGSRDYRVLSIH